MFLNYLIFINRKSVPATTIYVNKRKVKSNLADPLPHSAMHIQQTHRHLFHLLHSTCQMALCTWYTWYLLDGTQYMVHKPAQLKACQLLSMVEGWS